MQTIKELVFVICIACLTAGVILQIFEKDSAKRCIKAVAGLYILVAVLQGCGDFEQNIQTWSTEQTGALTLPTEQESDFSTSLLEASSIELANRYKSILLTRGIVADVIVIMSKVDEVITVKTLEVYSENELIEEDKNYFSELIKQELAFDTVQYYLKNADDIKTQEAQE